MISGLIIAMAAGPGLVNIASAAASTGGVPESASRVHAIPNASGGGCGTQTTWAWGYESACISAPQFGQAKPDAYVTLYAGHPACTINLTAYSDTGQVMKSVNWPCQSSGTWHYWTFFNHLGGNYFSVVTTMGVGSTPSPYLTLP